MDFKEIRQKYPDYSDMSDEEFATKFHKKFYSDMPFEDFKSKVGYSVEEDSSMPQFLKDAVGGVEAVGSMISGVPAFIAGGIEGLARAPFQGVDKAIEEMRKTQEYKYHPKTKSGKLAEQGIGELFQKGIEGGTPIIKGMIEELPVSDNAKESIGSAVTEAMLLNMPLTGLRGKGGKGKVKKDPVESEVKPNKPSKLTEVEIREQLELDLGHGNKYGKNPSEFVPDENGIPIDRKKSMEYQTNARQGDLFEDHVPQDRPTTPSAMKEEILSQVRTPSEAKALLENPKIKEVLGKRESGSLNMDEIMKGLEELASKMEKSKSVNAIRNNASGESSASLEAQSRLASETAKGQNRVRVKANGEVEPIIGVDAVDAKAYPGEVILQKGIGKEEWTVLDSKGDVPRAKAILGRSQSGAWTPFAKKEKSELASKNMQAMERIPGAKKNLKYMLDPENLDYATAKKELMNTPDIKAGDFRNNVLSGGQMMSQFFKNDLITWSIGMVKHYAEKSRIAIRDTEKSVIEAVQAVKKVEGKDSLISVMDSLARGEPVADLGPKAKELYSKITNANNEIYDMLNEEYKAQYGKDLPKRENYFTHSWSGPWGFEVYGINEKGNRVLIDVIREKTRRQANKAREWASQVEGVEIGEVTYNSKFERMHNITDMGFFEESMAQLMELSSQPSAKAREAQKAFRDHFKRQNGVGGYLGNKPWKSPKENMADALDSFYGYVSAANQWANGMKAKRELNKFISDAEINAPNAKGLAQQYFNNAFSRNRQLIELQDSLAESFAKKLGISSSSVRTAVRNNKAFMTMITLSWSPRFLLTQVLQPVQTVIPKMLEISDIAGFKASHSLNFMMGFVDGMTTGKATPEGKMLWKWAEANHVIDPRVIEHIEGFSKVGQGKYYFEQGLTLPNKWAEKLTRFWAFSTLYRTAKEMGLNEKDSLNLAKNQTQTSMVSYELTDRPLAYGKLGTLGEASSNLQTYKHNNYSALVDYYKTGKNRGEWRPFVAQVGMQLAVAGTLGIYGLAELELIWEAIKGMDNIISGGKNTKDIPSLTEIMVNSNYDFVTFGPASALTGLDLQASFAAAGVIPESAGQAVFPLINKELQMIQSGLQALKSWDNIEDWGVFLDKSLPTALKGHTAEHFLTKEIDGNRVKIKPSLDPQRRIAEIINPPKSYYVQKRFGTQPLELTKKNRLMFEDMKSEANLRDIQTSMENKIFRELSKGEGNIDKKVVGEAFRKYTEAGGDEARLRASIEKLFKQRGTDDPVSQLSTGSDSTAGKLRDKRVVDRFRNVR